MTHDHDSEAQGRASRGALPVFPRVPTVRRRTRRGRRLLSTVIIAGLAGGAVAVVADRSIGPLPGTAGPAPQSAGSVPSDVPAEQAAQGTVARVAARVLPSVVRINHATSDSFAGSGNGSGVVYRRDGLIVTNNHVVETPGGIEVVFADGRSMPARIVGQDVLNDLAVVRVDRVDLTPIALATTDGVQVGDLAIAVGSPFGLDATVTVGVVSAIGRGVRASDQTGQRSVYLPEVVQTDAPINPGNSGGALVDDAGRLMGINSAILTDGQAANAGVGFAIPVDTVVDVADELIAEGRVRHPLLGVSGGPVTPQLAPRLGVTAGAWIHDVAPGTPAADAGLAPDDVVVGLDGARISSMEDLSIAVRDHDVGDRIEITYVRDGTRRTIEVTLAERTDADPQ